MKTIGDRIFDIMIYYFGEERGNKAKFAKTVNEKPNTVGNWFARGDSIGKDVINKIITTFPNIDSNWLLTGEGEMLKNNQQIGDVAQSTVVGANVNGNGINITNNNFSEMIELQKGYQELLKKKDEHISELLSIVNKLTINGK
jgi:hypothetical protein